MVNTLTYYDTTKLCKAAIYEELVFIHGKPFHPSLMFLGEAKIFTLVGSDLTHKHLIRPKRTIRYK